jgi:hypothetical protein
MSEQSSSEPQRLRELRAEVQATPALVEAILGRPDALPPAPEAVLLRMRRHGVDRGVARALALAVVGISAQVEFT